MVDSFDLRFDAVMCKIEIDVHGHNVPLPPRGEFTEVITVANRLFLYTKQRHPMLGQDDKRVEKQAALRPNQLNCKSINF